MIDRRAFLKSAALPAIAALCAPSAEIRASEPAQPAAASPVIDTHMHVWSDDLERFPFAHPYQPDFRAAQADGSLATLVADMDAHGVTHCVLVQTIFHGWDNRYLVHCVKSCPARFHGHGLIDPLDPNVADKLDYWVADQGLSGMRLSPIYYKEKDDWLTAAPAVRMWKKAAELGAILNFYIATGQLPKLEIMVRQFPEVRVAIDHLSQIDLGAANALPEIRKLLAMASYPNVWVKVSELTSISTSHKYPFRDALPWLRRIYDEFGPERLLWGTGYPGKARDHYKRPSLAQELALVRQEIPFFSGEDQRKILGENAAALWKFTM